MLSLSLFVVTSLFVAFLGTSAGYESTCSGPVQDDLMYNVGLYSTADVGLPNGSADEPLPDAVCCDVAYRAYAEPNGFYKFPDVSLFKKVDSSGVTTFYDSVCGVPLFQAPVGRSFEEWVAETSEHGWPSFRSKEVISALYTNVTDKGMVEVYSSCGTYLGTNLADDSGDRYCMDLSCISGHAV